MFFLLIFNINLRGSVFSRAKSESESLALTFRSKHMRRVRAYCPLEVKDEILKLLEQCTDIKRKPERNFIASAESTTKDKTDEKEKSGIANTTNSKGNHTSQTHTSSTAQHVTAAQHVSAAKEVTKRKNSSRKHKSSVTDPHPKLPSQCTSAWTLNLTESKRQYFSSYSELQQDYKFLDSGRVWFRFLHTAGNRLAASCPPVYVGVSYGCGRYTGEEYAYWSNSTMPQEVGESTEIVFFYGCDPQPVDIYRGTATRCTESYDGLVYRFEDVMRKHPGIICGMH